MIKIDLTNEQRSKIEEILCQYIRNNKMHSKIKELKELLETNGCTETANTLSKQAENCKLFLLNGRCSLSTTIKAFDNAIKQDSKSTKELIKLIKCGQHEEKKDGIIIQKKVWGFKDIYKDFSNSDQAYDILITLGINVCPYCNRQYTFTVRKKENKSRPQFDHFYPISKYPYLAISIYNLVPSCGLCNRGKSDTSPVNFLYPYEESFEDKGIYFEVHNIIDNLLKFEQNQKELTVSLESKEKHDKLIEQYKNRFKIELLYNEHKQYISELLQKNYVFNEDAIESIYNSYKGIFNTPSEVKQLIFGNCEPENFNQKPLSKLTNDIMKQLNCK